MQDKQATQHHKCLFLTNINILDYWVTWLSGLFGLVPMSADNEVQLYAPVDGLPQDEEGEGNWHFQVLKISFLLIGIHYILKFHSQGPKRLYTNFNKQIL